MYGWKLNLFDSLAKLEFPVFTNEGYVIEAGCEFLEYSVGDLSKIVPYQWKGPDREFMDRRETLKLSRSAEPR